MTAAFTAAIIGVATILPTAAGWWLRRRYLTVTVDGESMLPTYRPGERLLVRRIAPESVRSGQVVVLSGFAHARPAPRRRPDLRPQAAHHPRWIVKRIAAIPGDPIPRDTVAALRGAPGTHVPAGHVVVLGDNLPHSFDSRQAGYVTADRLLGVVERRLHR